MFGRLRDHLGLAFALLFFGATVLPARADESTFVRALIVASPTIRGSLHDCDLIRQVILEGTGGRCELRYIQETKETTPQQILAEIDKLRVQPTETLIFYYSGHGATLIKEGQQPEHFFYLDSGQHLMRKDLRNHIMSKRPRLAVMMTDCCSGAYFQRRGFPGRSARLKASDHVNPKAFRMVFLEPKGLADVTAATYYPQKQFGELAWFDYDGGLFTTSVYSLFFMTEDDRLSLARKQGVAPRSDNIWEIFVGAASEVTQERYHEYRERNLAPDSDFSEDDRKALREQPNQVPQVFYIPAVGTNEGGGGLAVSSFKPHGPGHFTLGIQVIQARDAAGQPNGVVFSARTPQARDAAILRLQAGDRIVAINNRPIHTKLDFANAVDTLDCRQPASMTLVDVNSGNAITVQVKSSCQ